MRKEYIWEVKAENPPLLKRKCSHCSSERFYCSERFRMNSQKKNIDIWLIYRCKNCDDTYNMTIFSRISREAINKKMFDKFSNNNTELAWKYAFSRETSRKNNAAQDFDTVGYDIQTGNFSVEDILNSGDEVVTLKIRYPFDFSLRLSSVIRTGLNLSANKFNKLIEAEGISVPGKNLQKKHKLKNDDIVLVDREKLKCIY